MSTICLVVPVFDEAERIGDHLWPLAEFVGGYEQGSELVFVDDGSRDSTAALIEEFQNAHQTAPVRLLRRPHLGKGAAVTAGLRSSTADIRGFCDLDLSTPLDEVARIITVARRAPTLAIGSRDLPMSRLVRSEGTVREALGRLYNRLVQGTLTPGVVDTQCGAKMAAASVWEQILPHSREVGFAWDVEVIALARVLGIELQEVPVDWSHDERSKVRVSADGAAMVLAVPRIRRTVSRTRSTLDRSPARRPGDDAASHTAVFDDENASKLMAADRDHWWFRSKAAFVSTAIGRTMPVGTGDGWLVDAGAGAGGVTSMLGWRPERVAVVEGSGPLVAQARRVHGLTGLQGDVAHLPLADASASVVCLLDVIEHLDDPGTALREAARLLEPGGRVLINVPAHRWLWSSADEELGHVRRYDRRELRRQLDRAGLELVFATHVFSWLVPPVYLTRRLAGQGEPELGLDRTSALIDFAAMALTSIERTIIGRVASPLGTSLLCVAVRRPQDDQVTPVPSRP